MSMSNAPCKPDPPSTHLGHAGPDTYLYDENFREPKWCKAKKQSPLIYMETFWSVPRSRKSPVRLFWYLGRILPTSVQKSVEMKLRCSQTQLGALVAGHQDAKIGLGGGCSCRSGCTLPLQWLATEPTLPTYLFFSPFLIKVKIPFRFLLKIGTNVGLS